jgi:hypothetical protein
MPAPVNKCFKFVTTHTCEAVEIFRNKQNKKNPGIAIIITHLLRDWCQPGHNIQHPSLLRKPQPYSMSAAEQFLPPLDPSSLMTRLNLDFSAIFLLFVTLCAFLIPIAIILPPVSPSKSDALLQTHSLAGLAKKTNLPDQFSQRLNRHDDGAQPRVQALMIHPVKSCKGIEVSRSRVLPHGLEFDRLFTFAQLRSPFPLPSSSAEGATDGAKKSEWEFITLRQFPALATVTVELWLPDEMKLRKQSLRTKEAFLILRFPWMQSGWKGAMSLFAAKLTKGIRGEPEMEVLVPVAFPSTEEIEARGYVFDEVKVWGRVTRALDIGSELPGELRRYLGVSNKLSLFRIDPEALRQVDVARAGLVGENDLGEEPPVMGFQDAVSLPFDRTGG